MSTDAVADLVKQSLEAIDRKDFPAALRLGQEILARDEVDITGRHITGLALLRLGHAAEALPHLVATVQAKPQNGLAIWQLGQAYAATGSPGEAVRQFDRAESLGVVDPLLVQQRYDAATQIFRSGGDWSQYDRVQRIVRQHVLTTDNWIIGESTLASPLFSNHVLKITTENHARAVLQQQQAKPYTNYAPRGKKIRLGFVGCDFFEQATSYLMVAFIEKLDRQRFDVIAYDFDELRSTRQNTVFRQRVIAAYDKFIAVSLLNDQQAAEQIHADGIDVLFSIKNPASSRLGLFARRPAPIQVHYLYYPGTSGMPFFDFIVADEVVIPQGAESAYSEQVIRMSGCYQPNDPDRVLAADTSRAQWGLPEDAVLLANFSQAYKFTPSMMDLWCVLLRADHHRRLWMLGEGDVVINHLRREASIRGIAPDRLIFSPKEITSVHLSRLRHADLVLDTFPYGGHTLTSDALWSGTPVVTLSGETFASRVAASLLTHVGLPELVATTEQEYLGIAERLLQSPSNRARIRHHLDTGRTHFSLFDANHYAWDFGRAVEKMLEMKGREQSLQHE